MRGWSHAARWGRWCWWLERAADKPASVVDRAAVATVFDKLNLRHIDEIVVVDAPGSFEPALAALAGVQVLRSPAQVERLHFALAFVKRQADLDRITPELIARAEGDALLWFAYPKKSSRRSRSEIDRDKGWALLGAAGYEPVRIVAIDEDWSALRYRRVEHIASFERDPARALSAAGRKRAQDR